MSKQSRAPSPLPAAAAAAAAETAPPAQLATFATLASAAKLLLDTLGNRDFTADNHFALETLRRALRVSEPYIEIVLPELEGHGVVSAEEERSSRPDARASATSRGLLQTALPKVIAIARELAKTRDARSNGSVRLTLLRKLSGFLRVEVSAARKEVKRLEHLLEGKHTRRRYRRHRGDKVSSDGDGDGKERESRGGEGRGDGGDVSEGEDEDEPGPASPLRSFGAPSHADGWRSAKVSRGGSSAHVVGQAPIIRTQSPSTQRAEGSSSHESSVVPLISSRRASKHSRTSISRDVSKGHIVSQITTATLQVPSAQRAEGIGSGAGSFRASLSSRHATSRARSVASVHSSSRHTVNDAPAERSQSRSTQRIEGVSNRPASRSSHHASNDARSFASRKSSSQHVNEARVIQMQIPSTGTAERASNRSGSVRHSNKDSGSPSSKASSSQYSRVTRAPTISTISVESQAPSSAVANVGVGDSKAHTSRSSNTGCAPSHVVQDGPTHGHSSASHQSQSEARASSPAPFASPAVISRPKRSSNTSSHGDEKATPNCTIQVSQLHDGGWSFRQLPTSSARGSQKSKQLREAEET